MASEATAFDPGRVPEAVLAEFVTALGSVLTEPVVTSPAAGAPAGDGWAIAVRVAGGAQGTCTFWIDRAGAAAVTRQIMALDGDPDAQAIGDLLKEMWTQAASALTLKAPYTGLKLTVDDPAPGVAPAGLSGFEIRIGAAVVGAIGLGGRFDAIAAPAERPEPAAPPVQARAVAAGSAPASDASRLDVVLDIDLPLIVRFGQTEMTLKALTDLGPGSIVDMSRSPDDPVELIVGGQVIARGQVVIVGGDYGVRITDLASRVERAHAVEF